MKSRYECQDLSSTTPRPTERLISHHMVMIKWKPTRRRRRQYSLYAALLAILLLLLAFHTRISLAPTRYSNHWTDLHRGPRSPHFDDNVSLWKSLYGLIRNNNPQCRRKPDLVIPQDADIPFDPGHVHPRPDLLWLDDTDVTRLRSAHTNFISDIRSHALHLSYEPGTRGIVTLASEQLLPALSVSLRMLRKTSSTLPVDVFLGSPSARSETFCTKIFPIFNARCRFLSDIFAAAETPTSTIMHQSKVLSILFSTFEEVLFLDPSSFPVTAPEPLFHSVPFADTGLVLWPDFWYQSQSPYFFDIAKIPNIPPLNIRAVSQSNEMMYSKSKHGSSLMLATYYNFYGPEYYYLIQSQGGPGSGDKETFGLAATALDEPVYFVNSPVRSLGRHNAREDWIGTGMSQSDPVADFFSQNHNRVPVVKPEDIAHPPTGQHLGSTVVRPMFVNADDPKFDPRIVLGENRDGENPALRNEAGEPTRSWMAEKDAVALFGFDVEKRFWNSIEESTCGELLGLWLEGGKPDRRALDVVKRKDMELCAEVKKYNRAVFGAKL